MRPILTKLMSAGTGPQRGLFNVPVDPVKLGIPDYFKRVLSPMDLVRGLAVCACQRVCLFFCAADLVKFCVVLTSYNQAQPAPYFVQDVEAELCLVGGRRRSTCFCGSPNMGLFCCIQS